MNAAIIVRTRAINPHTRSAQPKPTYRKGEIQVDARRVKRVCTDLDNEAIDSYGPDDATNRRSRGHDSKSETATLEEPVIDASREQKDESVHTLFEKRRQSPGESRREKS